MMNDPYSSSVYETMRKNPPFEKWQLVETYNYDEPLNPVFCCIGRVISIDWSNRHLMWLSNVEININGKVKEILLYAHHCKPVILTGAKRLN